MKTEEADERICEEEVPMREEYEVEMLRRFEAMHTGDESARELIEE